MCVLCKRIYTVHRCLRLLSRFLMTSKHPAALLSLRLVESPTLRNSAQAPQSLRALLQALVLHAEPSLQILWNSGYILKATGTGDLHSHIVHARPRRARISASSYRLLHHNSIIRRNLQRQIKGIPPLTEDQFDAAITAADHGSASSSISGSCSDGSSSSDSEQDDSEQDCRRDDRARDLSHVVVRHPSGNLYLCWSSVFDVSDGDVPSQQPAFWSQPTAVILCSGGHFAATVFDRSRVVKSKTFHRYVVRAKQVSRSFRNMRIFSLFGVCRVAGRRNKIKKNTPAGNSCLHTTAARCFRPIITAHYSAGSSLRRHNEQQLHQVSVLCALCRSVVTVFQDIRDLFSSWSTELDSCCRIWMHAPGAINRQD